MFSGDNDNFTPLLKFVLTMRWLFTVSEIYLDSGIILVTRSEKFLVIHLEKKNNVLQREAVQGYGS